MRINTIDAGFGSGDTMKIAYLRDVFVIQISHNFRFNECLILTSIAPKREKFAVRYLLESSVFNLERKSNHKAITAEDKKSSDLRTLKNALKLIEKSFRNLNSFIFSYEDINETFIPLLIFFPRATLSSWGEKYVNDDLASA